MITTNKNIYLGIAIGFLILLIMSVTTFIIIGVNNKSFSLFDDIAVAIGLFISLLTLVVGITVATYMYLK